MSRWSKTEPVVSTVDSAERCQRGPSEVEYDVRTEEPQQMTSSSRSSTWVFCLFFSAAQQLVNSIKYDRACQINVIDSVINVVMTTSVFLEL